MNAVKAYALYLAWDKLATEQKIATEWCETEGEAIGEYLQECIRRNTAPTFDGLFQHLATKAPKS